MATKLLFVTFQQNVSLPPARNLHDLSNWVLVLESMDTFLQPIKFNPNQLIHFITICHN